MADNTLREKLRARRQNLNVSAQESHQNITEDKTIVEKFKLEDDQSMEEDDESDLKSKLKKRRERSRSLLEEQERQKIDGVHASQTVEVTFFSIFSNLIFYADILF